MSECVKSEEHASSNDASKCKHENRNGPSNAIIHRFVHYCAFLCVYLWKKCQFHSNVIRWANFKVEKFSEKISIGKLHKKCDNQKIP